ncbi:unannotated protein [freshwater metagenome]|uniref:Unannotated protein n=1 Tax=freshwater metagenome TaxID=449393 RepID=A0A6J7IWK2_9ZZZZ
MPQPRRRALRTPQVGQRCQQQQPEGIDSPPVKSRQRSPCRPQLLQRRRSRWPAGSALPLASTRVPRAPTRPSPSAGSGQLRRRRWRLPAAEASAAAGPSPGFRPPTTRLPLRRPALSGRPPTRSPTVRGVSGEPWLHCAATGARWSLYPVDRYATHLIDLREPRWTTRHAQDCSARPSRSAVRTSRTCLPEGPSTSRSSRARPLLPPTA